MGQFSRFNSTWAFGCLNMGIPPKMAILIRKMDERWWLMINPTGSNLVMHGFQGFLTLQVKNKTLDINSSDEPASSPKGDGNHGNSPVGLMMINWIQLIKHQISSNVVFFLKPTFSDFHLSTHSSFIFRLWLKDRPAGNGHQKLWWIIFGIYHPVSSSIAEIPEPIGCFNDFHRNI